MLSGTWVVVANSIFVCVCVVETALDRNPWAQLPNIRGIKQHVVYSLIPAAVGKTHQGVQNRNVNAKCNLTQIWLTKCVSRTPNIQLNEASCARSCSVENPPSKTGKAATPNPHPREAPKDQRGRIDNAQCCLKPSFRELTKI